MAAFPGSVHALKNAAFMLVSIASPKIAASKLDMLS
jgi:hypothetical protein